MQRSSSELLRQIRQRPGMYVGDTGGYGLHRLPLLLLQAVLMDGLTVLLDVTVPRPVWLGPVKGELANEECEFDVTERVQAWLRQRFEEEPTVAAQVLDHVIARYIALGWIALA